MMSKEREIILKAANILSDFKEFEQFASTIYKILDQPEQDNIQYLLDQVARLTAENAMLKEKWLAQPEQNPVAWIDAGSLKSLQESTGYALRYLTNDVDNLKPTDVPLYLAPPKRESLSDKEITKNTPKLIHIGERLAFHAGVRFAEKHHGIGCGE